MTSLTRSHSKVLWSAFLLGQIAAIGLARLAVWQPLYAVALVYAVGFCVVAWNRPAIAFALVFALAPWQQSISPGGAVQFSLTEINLALMLPVVLVRDAIEKRRLHFGALAAPLALYFAICLLASMQSWRGRDAVVSLVQMLLYLVLGLIVFSSYARRVEEFWLSFRGLLIVGIFFSITMLVQHTNFILGLHKNGVGASLACALLVGVEMWFAARDVAQKRWIACALAVMVVGLAYSLSRGAWLGAVAGLLWITAMRGQWKLLIRGCLIFLPLLAIVWSSLPPDQREYAGGFGREHWNINERYKSLDLARGNWEKNPILGVGVGLREEYDATNVAWLTLAETGVVGLAAFALMHVTFLRSLWRARSKIGVETPGFSLLVIGGALMLRQLGHGMVDHYWGRGPLAMTWAAIGMAIWAMAATGTGNRTKENDTR